MCCFYGTYSLPWTIVEYLLLHPIIGIGCKYEIIPHMQIAYFETLQIAYCETLAERSRSL